MLADGLVKLPGIKFRGLADCFIIQYPLFITLARSRGVILKLLPHTEVKGLLSARPRNLMPRSLTRPSATIAFPPLIVA